MSPLLKIQSGDTNSNTRQKKPLYSRERVATFFTLILSGKVEILSGRDEVRVEYGAFQHLGEGCLKVKEGTWKPDFSAFVIGDDARCLRIPCKEFYDKLNPTVNSAEESSKKESKKEETGDENSLV